MCEQYQKYRDTLQTANTKTQEELDKSLITLSTVIIGVVLTLRQQISSSLPNFGFPIIMWLAVVFLLGCVLSVLVSHFLSLRVNQKIIDAIDKLQQEEGQDSISNQITKAYEETRFVRRANVCSALMFFLGLLTAVYFAALGAHDTMTGVTKRLEEGTVAPKLPTPKAVVPVGAPGAGNVAPKPPKQKPAQPAKPATKSGGQ